MPMLPRKSVNGGFTLIELMIIVVIVAILATLALPSYQSYIERGRVRTAQADLVALATAVENTFQRQLRYPQSSTSSTDGTEEIFPGWHPAEEANFTYTYTPEGNGYSVTAVRIERASCTLTLDHANNRSITGDCGGITAW